VDARGPRPTAWAFGDRDLTKLFTFDSSRGDLVGVGAGVYLQSHGALVSSTDSAIVAQYAPAPKKAPDPSGWQMSPPSWEPDATSLEREVKAVLWHVRWDATSGGDVIMALEQDEDLWVTRGGASRTLRLRADVIDRATFAAPTPPNYRFAADGEHVVWIEGGQVHVVDLAGDGNLVPRTLEGTAYLDAPLNASN
jgi:hypothetical protein